MSKPRVDKREKASVKSVMPKGTVEKYQMAISDSGRVSYNCGDELAKLLEYKPIELVKALVAEYTEFDPESYNHLNKGMCKMNLCNRLRKLLKKGVVSIDTMEQFTTDWTEAKKD